MTRAGDDVGPFQGLWLVEVAERLGFESLAERLGYPGQGAVFLVLALVVFDRLAYLQTGRIEATVNPIILIMVPVWPLAIWGTLRLRRKADSIVESLPDAHPLVASDREPDLDRRFLTALGVRLDAGSGTDGPPRFLTARLQATVVAIAISYHFLSLAVFGVEWGFTTTYWGPAVIAIRYSVMMPIFYFLGGQIASVLVAIHVVLPLWLGESGRIDFADPHGYGGLRPVGNLLKVSTLYYLVAVALVAVSYVPNAGISETNLYPDVTILLGTVLGVVLFFAPAYWLHRHMRAAKAARIEAIAEDIRNGGPDDDYGMFPETRAESPDAVGEYTHGYIRLSQVRSMHEYPIDVSMVQEFLFVLLLPYLADVSSLVVFEYL